MYARAVDHADTRLRELRQEERGEFALAAAALTASVIAAGALPELAAPLFLGGLAVGMLGVRTVWRRWDLLERLSGERDALVISEVRAVAAREVDRRQSFAALIRCRIRQAERDSDARVIAFADELEALASELEDQDLTLEATAAVACARLLSDVAGSPLLNHALPAEDLGSRVWQIRSGFAPVEWVHPALEPPTDRAALS